MTIAGTYALLVALLLSGYQLLAGALPLYGSQRTNWRLPAWLGETARLAGPGSFLAVSAAAGVLIQATLSNDFSLLYVAHHSNRDLPAAYKFAALWSGQEGSLLLWAWLLSGYGFLFGIRRSREDLLTVGASTVLSAVQIFFLLLLTIAARPFTLVTGSIPQDGFGLNPLLQYPEMVIHPPMLYLGYVGFSVPFALALSAMMLRVPGKMWIRRARRWTLITWIFLTCGIFLGAHWAYSVLGWGGYWGWDPVENASLMPWLTGTAFLHASMMYERRGTMKRQSVWLLFATFMLSILGTLLTRSGALSSVHSFAQSSLGLWFWSFLALVMVVCVITYVLHRDSLAEEQASHSFTSRESSLVFNNLLLFATCFLVLWGTLFPVLSEHLQGDRIILGPAFFNRVAVPLGILLLVLIGVSTFVRRRSTTMTAIRAKLLLPGSVALAAAVILITSGISPWKQSDQGYAFVTWTIAVFVVVAMVNEWVRGINATRKAIGQNFLRSTIHRVHRNRSRYGGHIAHLGIVVLFAGIAGSAFNESTTQELTPHHSTAIGPYRLQCVRYGRDSAWNYDTEYALLDVYRGSRTIAQLMPERRLYLASRQPLTVVANHSTLAWDLYIVYAGREPDTQHPIIKVFLNPLVAWVWVGMSLIILGSVATLVSLRPFAIQEDNRNGSPAMRPAGGSLHWLAPSSAYLREK